MFSPAGDEVLWCTNVNWYTDLPGERVCRLYFMKMIDGIWTAPAVAPFTQHISVGVQRPRFAPGGNRLFFESHRDPNNEETDTEIYVVEREGEGGSDPASVSPLVNSRAYERLHCVAADGSLVFTRDLMTNREGVFISRFVDGAFAQPERLGAPFDTDETEYAIAVAPDESYVLVDLDREVGPDELHISYREVDGTWSELIRTPYHCSGLMALSPDGNYLFFHGEGIYWVDTSFVEDLKPRGRE